MSIRAMQAVWQHSKQSGGALVLLLAIADNAHDDGGGAYPSIGTLAKKARMTERNVNMLLLKLVEAGELAVTPGGGRGLANNYRLILPGLANPEKISLKSFPKGEKVSVKEAQNPEISGKETLKPTSPQPLIEPLSARTEQRRITADSFAPTELDQRWAHEKYPQIDLDYQTELFLDHARATGRVIKDWSAAWKNWIRKAPQFSQRRTQADMNSGKQRRFVQ